MKFWVRVLLRNSTHKQEKFDWRFYFESSRRRWLTAVLSHHRAYRSVHGGFNSWRAQTDRLWLNHKSHCLSVFLLSWLSWLSLDWHNTSVPFDSLPPCSHSIHEFPFLSDFSSLFWAISIVSIYTCVFCDRAIHWCHLYCSSCLQFRNSWAILLHTPWFSQDLAWLTDIACEKTILSV